MDAQNAAASPKQPQLYKEVEQKGGDSGSADASVTDTVASLPADKSRPNSPSAPDEHDSDAETVVLPGKDGYSPSKIRKVRHEDKSNGGATRDDEQAAGRNRPGETVKRKSGRDKDGSSGLSSVPTSPTQRQHRPRRRSTVTRASFSDSDQLSKQSLRDKFKVTERLVPHKRKASREDSDDERKGLEDEHHARRARRQRTASAGLEGRRSSRDRNSGLIDRSTSPQPRHHRRSASTQHSNGTGLKKRRLPPPLQATEYHSDESSANGSPHPRSSKLRSLALTESNLSPAKAGPPKKHLDAHGQTQLARACARGDYDNVKARLADRRGDLDFADYAGNSPLQIAALNGHTDIVKLLIAEGCDLACQNNDKDTPLLDAVDNGHLDVVRLLLDAGVNPRKANVNGEEPIDRVTEETENAQEIRDALMEAKERAACQPRNSEERQLPDSSRDSPAAALASSSSRRGGTVRSTKTRNDLLYMPLNEATLRQAAGRGDTETVMRVLQVKDSFDDPESMVAAARGGHDLVMQLLLGIGGANPDPRPISSQPSEYATPILAAIGQENIKVLELLIGQGGFDPTKLYRGKTYHEVAKGRQGVNWQEEERLLRDAFDNYKPNKRSPNKKERERERGEKRGRRNREDRNLSSPSREGEPRKKSVKPISPHESRRSDSITNLEESQVKRNPSKHPKKDDRVANDRERDLSPSHMHKAAKFKSSESDMAAMSSEGETAKPRRKLISKAELRGERDRHRRPSMASNTSNLREPSSPHDPRLEDRNDATKLSERYHDRTKALKRDDSRDRLPGATENGPKRHRSSLTPDRPSKGDGDDREVPAKRRRIEGEASERRDKHGEDQPRKLSATTDGHSKVVKSSSKKENRPLDSRRGDNDAGRSNHSEDPIRVKSEDIDVDMPDVDEVPKGDVTGSLSSSEKERLLRKRKRKAEEAQKRKDDEEKQRQQTDTEGVDSVVHREEDLDRRRREKEEKQEQEADRKKREAEEEEEKKRVAQEAARREAEAAAEKERREEEKQVKEEEDRQRREEEDKVRRQREAAEEELRKQREEQARREREEEERRERERRERAHREELEKKRAAREAEQRRIREEQARALLEKLPALLRWLSASPNPKRRDVAERFRSVQGVRYDTINPSANGTPEGREKWLLSPQVALLLGEKDLGLSRYTAWERVPASVFAKHTFWKLESQAYALTKRNLFDLGRQLPDYYGSEDPTCGSMEMIQHLEQLRHEAKEKFFNMDMFFIKLSDFLYTVPNVPHLRNVKIAVHYRELIENDADMRGWGRAPSKYKTDPDASRYMGFAPKHKYYINGSFVDEDLPSKARTSKEPFPEQRVPRKGLVRVYPDEPDYERICVEQGLEHLLKRATDSPIMNGVYSSPRSRASEPPVAALLNGHTHSEPLPMDMEDDTREPTNGNVPNGINGSSH